MDRKIPLFHQFEIETQSTCNRVCNTCIRNSHPDRDAVAPWFSKNQMHAAAIQEILVQLKALDYQGSVCLSHYNEPLQDERIVTIAQAVSAFFPKNQVFLHTNADFMTEEIAAGLDGYLHHLTVALYMDEPKKSERAAWIKTLFKKSEVIFTGGVHIPTHFTPGFDLKALIKQKINEPCFEPTYRMVLNHRGQMMLCCDDLIGNFDLGTFPKQSIEELWFSPKHQEIYLALQQPGSRKNYAYCRNCPR